MGFWGSNFETSTCPREQQWLGILRLVQVSHPHMQLHLVYHWKDFAASEALQAGTAVVGHTNGTNLRLLVGIRQGTSGRQSPVNSGCQDLANWRLF